MQIITEDPDKDLTGLGRLLAKDPRDQAFVLKAAQPKRGVSSKTWYARGVLDQGSTPQCVAYSGAKYLEAGPVPNKLHMPIGELYRQCQLVDEWPGENYDGTSVRALFKVLKREGYIGEYRWAYDVDTMVNHVLSSGPVVIGVSWFENMMTSGHRDFLMPTGDDYGGHATLIIGANLKTLCYDGSHGAFTILNSWGPRWSTNGRAKISFNDMQKLLDLDGEACVATEIPRAA
jgi:hypothetical protein